MFVLKNAWKSVIRNKGRNILIIIIVAIIAAAATIGLAIRQSADAARQQGLRNTTVTGQISVDRTKLINASQSSSGGAPNFNSIRQAISSKQLKLADYEKYAKASPAVTGTYYYETTSLTATSSFQPISTSNSSSSSSSGSSGTTGGSGNPGANGGFGGGKGTGMASGDFQLTGFSSDIAVEKAQNGKFTMTSGKVFGYDSASDGAVIISKSLADFNKVAVGSTITVENTATTSKTYKLKVVGIYQNSTNTSGATTGGPGGSAGSDPANAIYTSVSTLTKLGLNSGSSDADAAQLSYSYVFANQMGYDSFVSAVKKAGLSSDYTVSSADVSLYAASLVPLNNLSQFALTLLLIVLGVGAIVLVTLNLFNVRERKYEVGVLTAIGVRKSKVALQFVIELFIVTMIGLAIGVAGGAAASIPVSNQLLASQVAAQQSQQQSQQQQFGRGFQAGAAPSGSAGGNGSSTGGQSNNGPALTGGVSGRSFGKTAVNYISSINASVNLKVVGQLVLIGLALTIISALVAIIFVMRYEPLQILADRS